MGNKRTRRSNRNRSTAAGLAVTFAIVGIALGAFAWFGSGIALVHDDDVRAHGVVATGVVTEVVHYRTHSKYGSHEHYYPVITTSIDGHVEQTRTRAYNVSDEYRFAVGQTAPVLYDSRDHTQVVPNWAGAHRDVSLGFWFTMTIGLVFMAGALACLAGWAVGRRRLRRAA